jgi:WD40 repeat protein
MSGQTIVTGSQDRTAKTWRLRPGIVDTHASDAHAKQVNAIARTPGGEHVVSVSQDRTMKVWDGSTGDLLHTREHLGWAQSLTLSDDGLIVLTGSLLHLAIWDVATGQRLADIPVHDVDGIRSLVRSPDNRYFVLGSAQGDLYYFFDGQWIQGGPLSGHADAINMMAMAPDAQWLASASQDATVRLWDLTTNEHRVLAHDTPVFAVCFTTDGRSVVSGADDGVIRLWNTLTATETARFTAHDGWVLGLAVLPDGRHLISAGEDASLAIWDLTDHRLVTRVGLDTVLWCVSEPGEDHVLAVGDLAGGVQLLGLEGIQRAGRVTPGPLR